MGQVRVELRRLPVSVQMVRWRQQEAVVACDVPKEVRFLAVLVVLFGEERSWYTLDSILFIMGSMQTCNFDLAEGSLTERLLESVPVLDIFSCDGAKVTIFLEVTLI